MPHEKGSFTDVAEALGPKWTAELVELKAREYDKEEDFPICVVRGGVQYFGSETGAKPGLYKELRRGIENRWGRDNSMPSIVVRHTSRTSVRGSGVWTQPDLVAQIDRRSDAKPPVAYMAIEAEQPGGFGIQSVYQAHEFGRGADYACVFYTGEKCPQALMRRTLIAAKDLGVGIVHAPRPTRPADWTTIRSPDPRDRTAKEQADFFARSGLTKDSFRRPT